MRVYLNTLFLEGKLKPVPLPEGWQVEEWAYVGLEQQSETDGTRRFNRLLQHLQEIIPPVDALHKDWLQFAEGWAELVGLRCRFAKHLGQAALNEYAVLHLEVEVRFADWLLGRYHTLHNQPFHTGPVMGHHIPGYLEAYRRQHPDEACLALVVVDGLALDQWHIIRAVWTEEAQPWTIRAGALFAWAPTLTSIARQAVFAGKSPQLFPQSWQSTDRESKRWRQIWQEHGLPVAAIGYARNLGTSAASLAQPGPPGDEDESLDQIALEPEVLAIIENPRIQVAGLVVNTVDNISHGMQLGTAGMHQQVQLWLTRHHYLTDLVAKLLAENFTVFLTADHDNVWARGIGRPNEGVLVEKRGQRARVYTE